MQASNLENERNKKKEILGLHHVTAIASDPQRNIRVLHKGARRALGEAHREL